MRLPPGRSGLPSRVQGPKGPSGLLPSSPGSLPWHEVGTRPGWASGARLGVVLLVLSSGAGARGVPWARAPRSLADHAPWAQQRLTAALGPAAPQTGSGRLALTEGLVSPGGPHALLGVLWSSPPAPGLSLREETEAAGVGEKQAVLSRCSRQLRAAGDIWPARRAGLGLLAGWAPLTQTAEAAWGAGARAGRLAWGCEAQAKQPISNRWKSLVAGLSQADALSAERSIQESGRQGGLRAGRGISGGQIPGQGTSSQSPPWKSPPPPSQPLPSPSPTRGEIRAGSPLVWLFLTVVRARAHD